MPWSSQNPIRTNSYENGVDWGTQHLNFVYNGIVGYYNGVQAARKGCPWMTSFDYAMEGAGAIIYPATAFFAPWGELGESLAGSGTLDGFGSEAGYVGLSGSGRIATTVRANLDLTVTDFVGEYLKGSVRQELPGEFLNLTVREALESGNTTVRKLLTNARFWKEP